MTKRFKFILSAGFLTLCCLVVACPPPGQQRRTVKTVKSGSRAPRPSLFSVPGMTAAIYEIDAVRGSDTIKALQAKYEKMFKADPKNPFKRFLWAYTLNDRNQAWQEMAKATKLNAKFYWAYVGMGAIGDRWKVYDQSEKNFIRALELGPKIAIGYGLFGRMQLHKGDHARAVELLKTAVEKDAKRISYRLDLARAQAAAGQKAEAKASYLQVIKMKSDSFAAHAELARVQKAIGEKAAAVDSFAKAAELDPKSYPVRFERAGLLAALDRGDEAVAAYQDACRLKPRKLACWQALAALAGKLTRQDLRVAAFEKVIEIEFENLEAHTYLAPIYLEQGAIEKALPSYQLVLAKDKDNIQALDGLAQIYEKGEDFSKAIEFNQRVLDKQADHQGAKASRERLFGRFHILPKPISGKTPNKVFSANRRQIASVYKLRLKDEPGLRGYLKIKVTVDNSGKVLDVTVANDTVGDPVLRLCAVWNLKRSRFPDGYGATYDFELTLKPGAS